MQSPHRPLLIGIDPGITGGVAVLDQTTLDLLHGFPVPSASSRVLVADLLDALDLLTAADPYAVIGQVVIEDVHAMPKQGVSSTFTFGRCYGTLEGVVQAMRWPTDHISPAVWKRRLHLNTGDKDGARQWCRRRWPASALFDRKGKGQAIGDAAALAVAWWEIHR